MSRKSINGQLKPISSMTITDEYIGHFLKVGYIQSIAGNSVYSKDRVEVEEDGDFRLFLPKQELITEGSVDIEVFAPNGSLLVKQTRSVSTLYPADVPKNVEDKTTPFIIQVNPQINEFVIEPVHNDFLKISGKVVDASGKSRISNIEIIIYATVNSAESDSFKGIFSAQTNKDGYFFGRIKNRKYESAYATIAGLDDVKIPIELENDKIPAELLLVSDLSSYEPLGYKIEDVPKLPDANELVMNSVFSQDIGGKCVDFTTPNRTLEEYSFYHTVRTTEPEIRGLTITNQESRRLKDQLTLISGDLFPIFHRINSSMHSLQMYTYTVEEDDQNLNQDYTMDNVSSNYTLASSMMPIYNLRLESKRHKLRFNSRELRLDFRKMLALLSTQAERKAKLQQLQYELAAAYCGKNGAPQAKTYCETLIGKDTINRATIDSLLGHIDKYIHQSSNTFYKNKSLKEQMEVYVNELKGLMNQSFIDITAISIVKENAQRLIKSIDHQTLENQDQEELLGYMRRLIIELESTDEGGMYNFEPCELKPKTQTMGVMCMIQEFEEIRDTLRNKSLLTLGEILSIREKYDIYVISITTFLQLLEKFHSFYKGSTDLLVTLEDDHFVKNFDSIRGMLIDLKKKIYTAIKHIEDIESEYIRNHPGRKQLSAETSIDWDETPTVYENTTIAHGHILHFKQQWKADGYSLGDLLYSLPLAPCQEKQIAIIDWDREERGARTEQEAVSDSMTASLDHNRDISEIINSSFNENINASSHNRVSATAAGIGGGIFGAIGGLFGGVFHSGASSTSTASQNSARNLSGSTMNRLQDNVSQSASSLRTRRGTVIQTVGQNENVSVQTEVVKNNNHCHAITIEYFEVLRHFAVSQDMVDVQECLFVPLPMSMFDYSKVMRWDNTLRRVVYGQQLRRGFDGIKRISNNYADSDFPTNSYADEMIRDFAGHFTISFELTRPSIAEIDDATKTESYDLSRLFPWYRRIMKFTLNREVPLTEAEKDQVFEREYAPDIVRTFIDKLDVFAISEDGRETKLDLDVTMLSNYRRGAQLTVSISSNSQPAITRRQIRYLKFRANTAVDGSSKIILRSVYLNYKTNNLNASIINNPRVNNDIINSSVSKTDPSQIVTDGALIYTPLSIQELRNPRKEDREAAAALLAYLNEHLEQAHKAIWSSLDSSRLFGLLDGYIAPNSGGRSVASVVENKIMGIVGNNLVLKVVPGERLDPVFKNVEDLLNYYQPTTKPDPFRISVPTKGVYAESVLGKCNSCEIIDDDRFWKFHEAPCGTQPTSIEPISTASRRADDGNLQTKDMPSSIINMQNAPTAPDPTGLGAAFTLLGTDVFKDMTGLEGTQANAITALQATSDGVTKLAGMASDLKKQEAMKKDIGKVIKDIDDAKKNNQITDDQANKLTYSALSSMVGEPTTKQTQLTQNEDVKDLIKSQSNKPESNIKIKSGSESVEIDSGASSSAIGIGGGKPAVSTHKPAPGTNPGSTKDEAKALVEAFRTRSGKLKFNVSRADVANRLIELIDSPDKVDQSILNLCGPAAVVQTILRRDPKLIANCTIQLAETGQGTFGKITLKPGSDLRNQTFRASWGIGVAEWILMSSMRDDENWFFDYEGTPEEDISASTTPGEIEKWLAATDLFSKVKEEANLYFTKGLDHALELEFNNNTENILLIHSYLLRGAGAVNKKDDSFILNSFPNHWVVLNSKVKHESGRVKLDVWSWGGIYTIDVPEQTFKANYYGAVIAE